MNNATAQVCVIDSGTLLRKVKWPLNSKFQELFNTFDYVRRRYRSYERCCVVFDGYTDEPSIKSTEHDRRSSHTTSANVTVSETMTVTANREMFLRNMSKQETIHPDAWCTS